MRHFTVQELSCEQLGSAWPLVRSAASAIDLDRWLAGARLLADRGGGVLGVATGEGALLGVATYEPVDTRAAGKLLQVDTLVTFEFSSKAPIRTVLCEALERLASTLGCGAVAVNATNRAFLAEKRKRFDSPAV